MNFKLAVNINVQTISIQNVLGEQIFFLMQIKDNLFTIDLSTSPKGIYFAVIDTDKGRSVEKILLKN